MSRSPPETLIWPKGLGTGSPRRPLAARQDRLDLAASFAMFASGTEDLLDVEQEACRIAAMGLNVTFAKLLVHQPDRGDFLLRAGVGWRRGIVGRVRLEADVGTAAGFAWHSGQAIISNNLAAEGRFRVPDILARHGISRSVNVVIPGEPGVPFGILEVESQEPGRFTLQDVSYLQLLAQSLAGIIKIAALRLMYEDQAARSMEDHAIALHELQHRVRNDLQVIYSVIDQEARGAGDAVEGNGLVRVGRRVLALGSLYDHLLGQAETGQVDMGAYLHTLCDKISLAADLPGRSIQLVAQTDRVLMPLDRSVRIGVAVNELVINAVEHAFPEGGPGNILVRLIDRGGNQTGTPVVSVSDDGRGFDGPRFGGRGLGFVERLTRQAGGILHRAEGVGTHWNINLSACEAKN